MINFNLVVIVIIINIDKECNGGQPPVHGPTPARGLILARGERLARGETLTRGVTLARGLSLTRWLTPARGLAKGCPLLDSRSSTCVYWVLFLL